MFIRSLLTIVALSACVASLEVAEPSSFTTPPSTSISLQDPGISGSIPPHPRSALRNYNKQPKQGPKDHVKFKKVPQIHNYKRITKYASKHDKRIERKQQRHWNRLEAKHDKAYERTHGQNYKSAFKRAGLVVKRKAKHVQKVVDKGLAKASKKEKKVHNAIVDTLFKGPYKVIAKKLERSYFKTCLELEPILGHKLIHVLDKVIGGIVVIGKRVGKFIIDHLGAIAGIGLGILVGLTVTAGLEVVLLNPLLAGAIGGAVGGFVGTFATVLFTAILKGNLIPTSLEDATKKSLGFGLELGLATTLGGVAGLATGGLSTVATPLVTHGAEIGLDLVSHGVAFGVSKALTKNGEEYLAEKQEKQERKKWEKVGIHSFAERRVPRLEHAHKHKPKE